MQLKDLMADPEWQRTHNHKTFDDWCTAVERGDSKFKLQRDFRLGYRKVVRFLEEYHRTSVDKP